MDWRPDRPNRMDVFTNIGQPLAHPMNQNQYSSLVLLSLVCAIFSTAGAQPEPDWQLGPDSFAQEGVPRGTLTKHTWTSKIFEGTVRDYWVYVPAQYDPTKPAALMVHQDGWLRIDPEGWGRLPVVFDNLIHRGELPVIISLFINPGSFPPEKAGEPARNNRSFEYNTLSDQYVRFLLEEMIPELKKTHGLNITDDPEGRAIAGLSSGAICAFYAAWLRPDAFRRVFSGNGSYTAIAYRPAQDGQPMQPGGDLMPTLIRKNPIRPLRIFLQDGTNDLNNEHGNWFLANQQMLSSLEWANANADAKAIPGPRYAVTHIWGEGAIHNPKHCGVIFPEALRWLWEGYSP